MVKIKSAAHDIQFHLDEADVPHVKKILDRAHQMGLFKDDQTSHYMDLSACNANGTPLNFEKLAEADDFTLTHDFCGIWRHMDRQTGRLAGFFRPRCARPLRP